MTDLDLDALEAVANAATPGQWEAVTEGHGEPRVYVDGVGIQLEHAIDYALQAGGFEQGYRDAEHIATFDPPTVLALIAELRKVTAERDKAVHTIQGHGGWDEWITEHLRVEAERDAAYTAIREALTHDPLHGKTWGLHCGGMAPCIRAILSRIPTEEA